MPPFPSVRRLRPGLALGVSLVGAAAVAGCGQTAAATPAAVTSPAGPATPVAGPVTPAELRSYVAAVEAVRLPVNQLLNQADPIIGAYHDHRITPAVAAQRMDGLEQRFAALGVQMAAIAPASSALARLNAPYAHTYLLEDSYLATLASDLGGGDFGNLPDTQDQQRLAIIEWRTQLQLMAAQLGVALPADIQQAGRGEIAPSPTGS